MPISKEVIVRIAPSPSKTEGKEKSGLHLGNVRTALYNMLHAKKHGGHYLLRIENSDQNRSSATGAEDMLSELSWLGLSPTRGYGTSDKPAVHYTQMERLPIYKKYIDILLEQGLAYKCFCTAESLDKAREEAMAKNPKAPFKYAGICRDVDQSHDKDYVIRFKAPTEGSIEFDDLVFGKRSFPNKENYDFVICRQNGVPLFNFANAIDDFFIDGTTHIIRGKDHLANCVQQILIGRALGAEIPVYAHLSMILGSPDENGKSAKLSKRDGAVSVAEFKAAGYAPSAILNYLCRLGWAHGSQEVFSMTELVDKFDLNAVNRADAKFDYKKFAAINAEHLKSEILLPDAEYAFHLKPFLDDKGLSLSEGDLMPYIKVIRSRAKTFIEAANLLEPIVKETISIPQELIDIHLNAFGKTKLSAILVRLEEINDWTEQAIRTKLDLVYKTHALSLKDVGSSLRVALLGQTNSPELHAVMVAMGRRRVLERLHGALSTKESPRPPTDRLAPSQET